MSYGFCFIQWIRVAVLCVSFSLFEIAVLQICCWQKELELAQSKILSQTRHDCRSKVTFLLLCQGVRKIIARQMSCFQILQNSIESQNFVGVDWEPQIKKLKSTNKILYWCIIPSMRFLLGAIISSNSFSVIRWSTKYSVNKSGPPQNTSATLNNFSTTRLLYNHSRIPSLLES